MGIDSIDLVANQAAAAARNLAAGASANVRSEMSITRRAAELTGRAANAVEKRLRGGERRRARTGVYIQSEAEARARQKTGGALFTAPDGYIRQTPVQEIVEIPHYRAMLVRKILSGVLLAAMAVAVVWVLVRFNVIRF